MAVVSIGPTDEELNRRPPDEVLGIQSGPSRRGSTYWNRLLHCPFEHYLGNVLGLHSRWPNDPLDTGIIWHYALEGYYRHVMGWQDKCRAQAGATLDPRDPHFLRGADRDAQASAFTNVKPVSTESGYERIWVKIERMLDTYFTRWQSDLWEIVDVETTLETAAHGFDYSSKLDLFIIDRQGAEPFLRVVETKSTFRLDSFVMDGYTLDLQTLGQVYVVWMTIDFAAYPAFMGSYISITSKHEKVPLTERVPFNPTPDALDVFTRSMKELNRLPVLYDEMKYPKNFAQCTRRYGRCEFFNICRNQPGWTAERLSDMLQAGDLPDGFVRKDHHA